MSSVAESKAAAAQGTRIRATMLVMRYSLELTDLIERAAGVGTAGNQELQVLTHLQVHGASRRQDLIALTGLSRTGAAQLVQRLERLGLVESHESHRDHRMVETELTPLGRRRVKQIEATIGEYFTSPNPLVKELLELLTPPGSSSSPTTKETVTPLDALGRIVALGARSSRLIDSAVGLTETRQRLTLATLAAWGETRPGQLSGELGLTSGGTTYLVDQLESAGLVERLYGTVPEDRRAVVIRLTPSGQAASERFADVAFGHADELVEALGTAHAPR